MQLSASQEPPRTSSKNDFECYINVAYFFSTDHRHSSHHIHRPLSKLPYEGRRKKSSKKKRKDKDHASDNHVPSGGPIEEGEDEEEEEDEATETTPVPSESERVKDVEVIVQLCIHL